MVKLAVTELASRRGERLRDRTSPLAKGRAMAKKNQSDPSSDDGKKENPRGGDPSENAVQLLVSQSMGRCYKPDCLLPLFEFRGTRIYRQFDTAHILPAAVGGPRCTGKEIPPAVKHHPENLILLCQVHHRAWVDSDDEKFPVEVLKGWKTQREALRQQSLLEDAQRAVTQPIVTDFLKVVFHNLPTPSNEVDIDATFERTEIREKFDINDLNQAQRELVAKGLVHANQVKHNLQQLFQLNPQEPEKLVGFFTRRWLELDQSGHASTAIFDIVLGELQSWTQTAYPNGQPDTIRQMNSAALAVLAYLFETCDFLKKGTRP